MRGWLWPRLGGKRASDRGCSTPALPRRDRRLEQAIRRDRIELRFQPQIEPASGRIAGVEALARWDEVDSPEQLFARAEAVGLSERLSRSIQRKALRTFAGWRGPLSGLRLSINLLPRDLDRPGGVAGEAPGDAEEERGSQMPGRLRQESRGLLGGQTRVGADAPLDLRECRVASPGRFRCAVHQPWVTSVDGRF